MKAGYIHHLLMVILVSAMTASIAQPLTVIELRNRDAGEVIPTLRPFIKPGDVLSGDGYQLFIRTDPQTLADIRQFIAALDKTPAQLLISVRNAGELDSMQTSANIRGAIEHNGNRVIINDGRDNRLDIRAGQNETTGTQRQIPQIRATEGRPALIYAGISVPVSTMQRERQGNRVIERTSTEYRNVTSGFYVTAKLNDDEVILTVEPQIQSRGEAGAINTYALATMIRGRLGEWLPLGGIAESENSRSTYIGGVNKTRTQHHNETMIKVEKLTE